MKTSSAPGDCLAGPIDSETARGPADALTRRRRTKVDRLEDPLPEHVQYRDSGCEVAPACLSCPLPVCRYEVRGGLAAILRRPRDEQLLALHRRGAGIEGLCRRFGLSRRSVFRILRAAKKGKEIAGSTHGRV